MKNSSTYVVISNFVIVRSETSMFGMIIGKLSKGDEIQVTKVENDKAYFIYNNKKAYVSLSSINEVVKKGDLTIEYVDYDSGKSIAKSIVYSSIDLKTYTYNALPIEGYLVFEEEVKSISLTYDCPKKTLTFYYKKDLIKNSPSSSPNNVAKDLPDDIIIEPPSTGNLSINYLDVDTNVKLLPTSSTNDLKFKNYVCNAVDIAGYEICGNNKYYVSINANNIDNNINFYYKKIYGRVSIRYVDCDTNLDLVSPNILCDLDLKSYSFLPVNIPSYKPIGSAFRVITITKDHRDFDIIFKYQKIHGKIYVRYIDQDNKSEIIPSDILDNLEIKNYIFDAKIFDDYTIIGRSRINITLTDNQNTRSAIFEYKKNA